MQEKRTEIVKIQGLVTTIPSHQQLMKVNRVLMGMLLFLMFMVVALGFYFVPSPDRFIVNKNAEMASKPVSLETNTVVLAEVNSLKTQMVGLISGSIESKLSVLEDSIRSGAVSNSLGTIADLKNDIKVLRTYSEAPKKQAVVTNQELVQEVSHLKKLIYLTLGSCGLMFVAAAGVWVKSRELPYKEIKYFHRRR